MPRPMIIITSYILIATWLGIHNPLFFFMYLLIPILVVADVILSIDGEISFIKMFMYIGCIKRVKTDYGRFYIVIRKGSSNVKVFLYQDKIIYVDNLDEHWFTNVDSMKSWIKTKYDVIYRDKTRKDETKKLIKNWSGYIDIQSERDSKIDDVIN